MNNIPNIIYSGVYRGGHVQGIAVDKKNGFIYYSFTTVLVKTDLLGKTIGSVVHLAGHLGCLAYDSERDCVYGSLELKHDSIGKGIIANTGWDPCKEDNFYLVCFDCKAITKMQMDAEKDGIMQAVHLQEVCKDYAETDECSGKKHRYGCSGCDGTGFGPIFGADKNSPKKIMIAYGIYSDVERTDNDYQVILQYDPSIFAEYGRPLNQSQPHKSGPKACEAKYFFYTGNTTWGVQNLEYDSYSQIWFVAVYKGQKQKFMNFSMFMIDAKKSAVAKTLIGRQELGLVLESATIGENGKQMDIFGSYFPYGSTGIASLEEGFLYFSQEGSDGTGGFYTNVVKYRLKDGNPYLFEKV